MNYLFIGGIKNGQVINIKDSLPIYEALVPIQYNSLSLENDPRLVENETQTYRRSSIMGYEYNIYILNTLSRQDAMKLLLENYTISKEHITKLIHE